MCNTIITDDGTNVGIGKTNPSEKLDVAGNVRFSGALMPNNLPGTSGQILISQGPGVAPVWKSTSSVLKVFQSAAATRTLISTTQPNYTDVAGLTVTFTLTTSATVIISSTGGLETRSGSNGGSGCIVRVVRGGVAVPNAVNTRDVDDAAGFTGTIGGWSILATEALAAGTYTYKVQAAKYAFDNFYAGGNSTSPTTPVNYQNEGSLVIQVFEN
jgi:hypothetical protein